MMSKKIFCLGLILLVCFFVLGCEGKTSSLSGVVTGKALLDGKSSHSGIVVSVYGTSFISTTTTSDGSYSISDAPAGTRTLNFTKGGYGGQSKVVNVIGGALTNVDTVTLSSSYGGLTGTAKLESQNDHSGISVSIGANGYTATATTNSSGEFSYSNLPPGTVTINFSKSGFDSVTTTNTIPAWTTTNVSVTLNMSYGYYGYGVITGKIDLYGESDDSNAHITASGDNPVLPSNTVSDGSFTITNVLEGTYSLTITKEGFVTGNTSNIVVEANTTTNIGTIVLYTRLALLDSYDMSRLDGTILAMTGAAGFLFISTTTHIYSLSLDNPTTIADSIEVTNNFITMSKSLDNDNEDNGIICIAESPTGSMIQFYYEPDLSFALQLAIIPFPPSPAETAYDRTHIISYVYYHSAFIKQDTSSNTVVATYNVSETGIISLEKIGGTDEDYYIACNSTTFYEYNSDFSSVKSQIASDVGGGSNLVGIVHANGIWVVDASTKKLYKFIDNW